MTTALKEKEKAKEKQQDVTVRQKSTERTDAGPMRMPVVDIYETESGLTLVAEMPGVDADTVTVEVEKGVLSIGGQAAAPDLAGATPLFEGANFGGSFYRAFALSDEIDRDRTSASLRDGVLTVQLPKAEQAKTRRIKVEVGA